MTTEDYVSFNTAKLLKEKGFDELCHGYFRKDNPNDLVELAQAANWNDEPFFTSRPTLQMAMKWLRNKHNLHIEIRITNHTMSDMVNVVKYYWVMCNTETGRWCDESTVYNVRAFDKSEEAEEDAIRHALEKISHE